VAEFDVETGVLGLVDQLAQRQAGHMRAILDYVEAHTTLDSVGGAIMGCLKPRYDEGRAHAREGFRQGVTVCEAVGERAQETRRAYLDADRATVDRLRDPARRLGITFPEFPEPAEPTLGAAGEGAGDSTWSTDEGVRPWTRTTPGPLQPTVDGARAWASRSVNRFHPVESSVMNNFALRYPADRAMGWGLTRFWEWADDRYSTPTANATLRDRYEMAQNQRFAVAYDAGTQRTGAGSLTHYSDWSQDRTTERSVQAGVQVYSTVTQARSAWNALGTTQETATRRDAVLDVARGGSNTDNIDWAG
jgi:hypothetical protein